MHNEHAETALAEAQALKNQQQQVHTYIRNGLIFQT